MITFIVIVYFVSSSMCIDRWNVIWTSHNNYVSDDD